MEDKTIGAEVNSSFFYTCSSLLSSVLILFLHLPTQILVVLLFALLLVFLLFFVDPFLFLRIQLLQPKTK